MDIILNNVIKKNMASLAEDIKRISSVLEDAVSEKDWSSVKEMIDALDDAYIELDRQESGFDFDYE